ncbi:MAG TPA: hypothetical protein VM452_19780 [Caulifigura sp.]|jgi:hypothetical protein|nr:hypothetical protein [Caulifigura sp.]
MNGLRAFRNRSPRGPRGGFSLIEVSVGLIASTILLAGLSGSIYLVMQANRVDIGPFRNSSASAFALDEVTRELSYATAVRSVTPGRSIEVEIADRTGDEQPDVLRYEWSGAAGAPLQRTFNGGTPSSTISGLAAFDLQASSKTVVEQTIGTITGTSGPAKWYEKSSPLLLEDSYSVQLGMGLGTDFIPKLPEGALGWSITRVDVRSQMYGTASGSAVARVWSADGSRRPAALLSEVVVNESSLSSSMSWYTINFPAGPTLLPTQRACITFQFNSGSGTVMQVRYDALGLQTYGMLTTDNGGTSWAWIATNAPYVRIYGTYTYAMDGVVDVTKNYQTSVGVDAQVGSDQAARMTSSARLRNRVATP